MDQRSGDLHQELIVIDGLVTAFDGFSSNIASSGATALPVAVTGTDDEFEEAVLSVFRAFKDAQEPKLRVVYSASDISEAKSEGQTGIIMHFQNSLPIGTDLDRVWLFHHLGVRITQLTYNFRNFVGDGCLENPDGGLSRFGRQLVKELNDAGIVVDLSHAGPRTTLETVEHCENPPIVSHTGAAAVVSNPRNVSDEVIDAIAARGGVIGCCCYGTICWLGGDDFTIEDLIRHIDYVANRVGVDHVGIATDSQCTTDVLRPQATLDKFYSQYPELCEPFATKFGTRVEAYHPKGLKNLRDLPALTSALLHHGFSEGDVAKIMGANLLRVFRAWWGD